MLSPVLSLKETPYWNILSMPLSPKYAVLCSSFNSQDLMVNPSPSCYANLVNYM